VRARLFEPFVTHGKAQGTGLGLSIIHGAVEAHSGTVTVSSLADRGTKFAVRLPRRAAGRDVGGAPDASGHRHVLVNAGDAA
jgi:signal transduction histidine kinase